MAGADSSNSGWAVSPYRWYKIPGSPSYWCGRPRRWPRVLGCATPEARLRRWCRSTWPRGKDAHSRGRSTGRCVMTRHLAKQDQEWTAGEFPTGRTPTDKLRYLVRYAVLAPSRYNTQPWRFALQGPAVLLYA